MTNNVSAIKLIQHGPCIIEELSIDFYSNTAAWIPTHLIQ